MSRDDSDIEVQPRKVPKDTGGLSPNWRRGLYMLVFLILFGLGQSVLALIALIQFLSLLLSGERNTYLSSFGQTLGSWMKATAEYQSCATDDKPFPWAEWPTAE